MKVEEVRDFFLKLKQSVESSDKNWLSQNTSYPIEITHHGKSTTIENRDSFKKNYELIFNKEIRAAVRCQEFNKLFANWKGVMIGQGAVWFKLQNIDSYSTTKNITTSPYTDVTADESIKTIDINDRKKWQYRIISINSDISTEQFIKRCPSYRR